ncbi:MAG: hypothetical protein K2Q20_02470 [Phycisphaerales bacterium]|nr:hypothetical protein [Phycisphaerales bacterium]
MTPAPLCLTCHYDLSATPDGRCPECGNTFTHESVARFWRERHARPSALELPLGILSTLGAIVGLLALLAITSELDPSQNLHKIASIVVGLWLLALAETLQARRGRPVTNLATCAAIAPIGFAVPAAVDTPIGPVLLAGLSLLIGALWMCRDPRRNFPTTAIFVAGAALVIAGGLWWTVAADDASRGLAWTNFSWLHDRTDPNRYAIRARDAGRIGMTLVSTGTVLAIIATTWLLVRSRPSGSTL